MIAQGNICFILNSDFNIHFRITLITYRFQDTLKSIEAAQADSAIFKDWYDTTLQISNGLNFFVQDKWKILTNDFSIRQIS